MAISKPKFAVGERVLCFEPDKTKARVLYDAKILCVDFIKEGKARKETEYKIHFQAAVKAVKVLEAIQKVYYHKGVGRGNFEMITVDDGGRIDIHMMSPLILYVGWNSTWDRWANESFVLKDSEDNRKLQRKLAKRAIKKLKSHGRKKIYLPGVAKVIGKCSDPLSDTDSYSESDDDDDLSETSKNSETEMMSPPKRRRRKQNSTAISKQTDDATPIAIDSTIADTSQRRSPAIDIPPSLIRRLEEDNLMVKKQDKLVDLPCRLNIVQILENYAKYFALNVAKLPSSEKIMKSGAQTTDYIPPEKNLNLCKETCQELRVLFDFILPVVLLYNNEMDQYKNLLNRAYINHSTNMDSSFFKENFYKPLQDGNNAPLSPIFKLSPSRLADEPQGSFFLGAEIKKGDLDSPVRKKGNSSKSAKVSPPQRKTAEMQIIEETHTYLIPHQPNLDRTGLASDAQGRRRSSRLTQNLPSSTGGTSEEYKVSSPASLSCKGEELVSEKAPGIPISLDVIMILRSPPNHTHGIRTEKNSQSPLPLLCRDDDPLSCLSSTISLKQMCQEIYVGTGGDDVKKAVHLAQTWKFRLFPRDYIIPTGASVPVSLIYGIQHLLRLFVKLPHVFSKTDIPDFKLKIIYKHIQALLNGKQLVKVAIDSKPKLRSQSAYMVKEILTNELQLVRVKTATGQNSGCLNSEVYFIAVALLLKQRPNVQQLLQHLKQ